MSSISETPKRAAAWRQLPRGVWILGFVSLLMDVSSEMVHALLPVFLVSGLGASVLAVGIIEGVAEATSAITRMFSGALSDWFGKRKFLRFGIRPGGMRETYLSVGDLCWLGRRRPVHRPGG